jgi:hypothetical protein
VAPTRDVRALDRVQFKLKKVRKFLKGWGYNRARASKKRKKEISIEIGKLKLLEERQ